MENPSRVQSFWKGMPGENGDGSAVPSVPQPKSPPELYGRRRELAKVQRLEREIGFLEEELKSVEGLQLASRSCKEVADFVTGNADPFIPTAKKIRRSCRFWKWLCGGLSCFKVPWICCCSCQPRLKMPSCCDCGTCNPCSCCSCTLPKWPHFCFSCCNCKCLKISKCSTSCCCSCSVLKCPSCPTCSSISSCTCLRCSTCCPKCLELKSSCLCCHKSSSCCCCYPCYFCYSC